MTARKDPALHKKSGRPRKDEFPRDDPGALPMPVAPDGDDPELFRAAGLGVTLPDIAAGLGIPLADLEEGGKLHGTVRRGIYAYNLDVAAAGHLKARSLKGNPIPGLFYLKCRAAWRETGEREVEKKKPRKIGRVTLRGIKGGKDGGGAAGGADRRRGTGDGDSGVHAPDGRVDGPDVGDPRG